MCQTYRFIVCGFCYGAASQTVPCCNTCNEVIEAYKVKGWDYNINDFEICDDYDDKGILLSIIIYHYNFISYILRFLSKPLKLIIDVI